MQFALTAMYHWLFVPLTLGITFIIAFMETIYVRTGNPEWKRITKFWMKLFGINFAIGVATGIILEFEFGTNWSNYSWYVGDIFGAPLAIEGIMAFFLESTFIAVMFFGWDKVSKKFHLLSTWLVAFGANLSALWILVANGWMQLPVGMEFNPETARNEMVNFWEVLFSPMAINKFLHTVSSGYVLASIFVIGISAWYLLKKREKALAIRSITIAAVFGLVSSLYIVLTGDGSAKVVAEHQPMKLAAMEGLYDGQEECGLVAFGILAGEKKRNAGTGDEFLVKIEIPQMLSLMAFGDNKAFVPGINDLVMGNEGRGILSIKEKVEKGKVARTALTEYKNASQRGDLQLAESLKARFYEDDFQENYLRYFGYSFYDDPNYYVPNVPVTFYSFHIMVILGFYFILFFVLFLYLSLKNVVADNKFLLRLAIWTLPLPWIAGEAGWVVAEVGRQPWTVQDLLPTIAAVSQIDSGSVIVTFCLFAITFTILAIAEVRIMLNAVRKGSLTEGGTR